MRPMNMRNAFRENENRAAHQLTSTARNYMSISNFCRRQNSRRPSRRAAAAPYQHTRNFRSNERERTAIYFGRDEPIINYDTRTRKTRKCQLGSVGRSAGAPAIVIARAHSRHVLLAAPHLACQMHRALHIICAHRDMSRFNFSRELRVKRATATWCVIPFEMREGSGMRLATR